MFFPKIYMLRDDRWPACQNVVGRLRWNIALIFSDESTNRKRSPPLLCGRGKSIAAHIIIVPVGAWMHWSGHLLKGNEKYRSKDIHFASSWLKKENTKRTRTDADRTVHYSNRKAMVSLVCTPTWKTWTLENNEAVCRIVVLASIKIMRIYGLPREVTYWRSKFQTAWTLRLILRWVLHNLSVLQEIRSVCGVYISFKSFRSL